MKHIVVRLALMAVQLAMVAGCVPQARYEEARSALAIEQEGHRRTNAQLHQLAQKVDRLEKALAERERQLAAAAERGSAQELAANVAVTERDQANLTVEQLREELGRVGDHLRTFAEQKKQLATQLDAADARAKRVEDLEGSASRRTLVVRDVSLLLSEAITAGEIDLDVHEGRPVIRLEHRSAFVSKNGELQPGTRVATSAIARAARLRPETRVRILRRAADEKAATAELRRIADGLEAEGMPADRIEISVEKVGGEEGPIEIYVL